MHDGTAPGGKDKKKDKKRKKEKKHEKSGKGKKDGHGKDKKEGKNDGKDKNEKKESKKRARSSSSDVWLSTLDKKSEGGTSNSVSVSESSSNESGAGAPSIKYCKQWRCISQGVAGPAPREHSSFSLAPGSWRAKGSEVAFSSGHLLGASRFGVMQRGRYLQRSFVERPF